MKGAISCLFYGARTLACPASTPTDLMPPNISRGNRLTVLRLCDGRQAMLITRTIPGNLMRLATDTEYSDRIFFAGRLLAVSPFVVEISWRLPGRMPSIPNIRMGVLQRIISVGMTRPLVD